MPMVVRKPMPLPLVRAISPDLMPTPVNQTVTVWPKNDVLRALMAHPSGVRFGVTGSATWPMDRFTRRRIRDGDVTTQAPPDA
jgi:hypothetical protein